jgi:predicted NBD/HSP70 family sugar kinase
MATVQRPSSSSSRGWRTGSGPLPTAGAARDIAALLRFSGPLTRAEVGRRLGLSRATVSGGLAGLIRDGLAVERVPVEDLTMSRGRPPALIALSRSAGLAIGIDLGRRHIRVAIADVGHELLAERHVRFDVDGRPDAALQEIGQLVEDALAEIGIGPDDTIVGAALGLPAPVDPEGRPGDTSILPGWVGREPALELQDHLGLPVIAENDANLGALAEAIWGAGRRRDATTELLYIKAATGIGSGIILGGNLFRGASGVAGEIGHTTVADGGAICRCGNRGCLELVAGGVALVAQLAQSGVSVDGVPDLVQRARDGHLGCRRVLSDAGAMIGLAVATAVNLLNPQLVVLGGELGTAGDLVLDSLQARVSRAAMASATKRLEIVPGLLGDRAEVLGAVLLVLRESAGLTLTDVGGRLTR